jgi:hypothetical protein
MANPVFVHSLGPSCAYYEEPANTSDEPPLTRPQFFYVSTLPIDDPLSPIPPQLDSKTSTPTPQPFSARDNAALEEAWQAMHKHESKDSWSTHHGDLFHFPRFKDQKRTPDSTMEAQYSMSEKPPSAQAEKKDADQGTPMDSQKQQLEETQEKPKLDNLKHKQMLKPEEGNHKQKQNVEGSKWNEQPEDVKEKPLLEGTKHPPQFGPTEQPVASSQEQPAHVASHGPAAEGNGPVMLSQSMGHDEPTSVVPVDVEELAVEQDAGQQGMPEQRRKFSPFRNRGKNPKRIFSTSHDLDERSDGTASSDISGRPFARVPSFKRRRPSPAVDGADSATDSDRSPSPTRPIKGKETFVPVGVSRLHLVEMRAAEPIPSPTEAPRGVGPAKNVEVGRRPLRRDGEIRKSDRRPATNDITMLMKPIYWNPVNDISNVTRGVWFYQDSMLPVEQEVTTQLEAGYEAMRPWTEVWQEELDAIVKSGAADAELKAMHRLWPKEEPSRPNTATPASSRRGLDGSFGTELPNSTIEKSPETAKPYQKYSVIYLNAKEAQLLKPNLLPSETRGRKPLGSIRKGRQIGIAVIREFSRTTWEKLHGRQMSTRAVRAKVGAFMNQSGDAATADNQPMCVACKLDEQRSPDVTDLVLVIHGIGQKLSERVDSYHFTHAINSFRREVNVEMADQVAKGILRREHSGIMVLPINWRLTVSFDDQTASKDGYENDFRLKDITPDSLPAIRNLISDVMLDIPYYLSHHKEKMTAAVVKEANRVYRLWCRNNPGFNLYGRVHLIAHSLGSVMAMDILSKQPTAISRPTDLKAWGRNPSDRTFEFNTSSLFNCGSPSGFFLLLNKANLVPRKGRKAGKDVGRGIAGEASYGCLAVNNVYNIVHRNDPIAYQQNACVDAEYARSLLPAYIPSVSTGFLIKIGHAVWWSSSSSPSATYQSTNTQQRPSIQHLPSTVELETHNFTREEIAEKRMFLLNDNGQIDFFLSSGGIQYLDMIGAHSSYWISPDFVRFLVMELGREPGKEKTLPVLRARKRREWKSGSIG